MTDSLFTRRRSGILLPITAFAETPGNGDFDGACRFIDWLVQAGVSVWQILPMGSPDSYGSPYLSVSAHAGNPHLIGLKWLESLGLLPVEGLPGGLLPGENLLKGSDNRFRNHCLHEAFLAFKKGHNKALVDEHQQFMNNARDWLEDYALYQALYAKHAQMPWIEWELPLRNRKKAALKNALLHLSGDIERIIFNQFLFFKQWGEILDYAHEHGVYLFGDMPLFVAHNSADVWAHRYYFRLDVNGQAKVVAGVPPDYYSSTEQRWGNPHYCWEAMEADGFAWWIERIQTQLHLYDLLRLDHFRGLEAVWEIPAESETTAGGRWRKVPGASLLTVLHNEYNPLPIVAEDLGYITPEVTELRKQFAIPGMHVLQFAFDSDDNNPHLPEHHAVNSVVYTGTHDNDTTRAWFEQLDSHQQQRVTHYFNCSPASMPGPMVECALASVARLAVIPLQDVMGLGSGHRINTPGTRQGNWCWRFQWSQLSPQLADHFRGLNEAHDRLV